MQNKILHFWREYGAINIDVFSSFVKMTLNIDMLQATRLLAVNWTLDTSIGAAQSLLQMRA